MRVPTNHPDSLILRIPAVDEGQRAMADGAHGIPDGSHDLVLYVSPFAYYQFSPFGLKPNKKARDFSLASGFSSQPSPFPRSFAIAPQASRSRLSR